MIVRYALEWHVILSEAKDLLFFARPEETRLADFNQRVLLFDDFADSLRGDG